MKGPAVCPVAVCMHPLPWPKAAVCQSCFTRLPATIKDRLTDAKRRQAWHEYSQASIAARVWLDAHPVAADPRSGERP